MKKLYYVSARRSHFRHFKEIPPLHTQVHPETIALPALTVSSGEICETARPAGPPPIFAVVCACGDYDLKWE